MCLLFGGRADELEVAGRARRERRLRLEALRLDSLRHLDRLGMELALFVRFTETRPPPSTLEQCQQPVGTRVAPRPAAVDRFLLRALRVEALEYLMDEYAETLWQRLLSRNGVNARVLVA